MKLVIRKKLYIGSPFFAYWGTVLYLIRFCIPCIVTFPAIIRMFFILPPYLLWGVSIVTSRNRPLIKDCIKLLFVIVVFCNLLYFVNWKSKVEYIDTIYTFISFWTPFVFARYWKEYLNKEYAQSLIIWLLLLLFITCITTIIGLERYPLAARELATGSEMYDLSRYKALNIGGYDYVYALVFIVPFVFLCFIYHKKKWPFIVCIVCFCVCVVKTQYSFAILFVAMMICLSVMYSYVHHNPVRTWFVLISGGLFLLILLFSLVRQRLVINKLFEILLNNEMIKNNTMLSERINGVYGILQGLNQDNDATVRAALYLQSINSFIKGPLFGRLENGNLDAGGHSEILDVLVYLGLFGFVQCVWLIKKGWNCLKAVLDHDLYMFYIVIFIVFILFALLDTVFWCPLLMYELFVCPLLISKIRM